MSNPTAPARTPRAAGPGTSARLHRAAAAERAKLARKRDELARRSETLRSERQQVEIILSAVEERIALLDRLTGVSVVAPSPRAPEDGAQAARLGKQVRPGPAISETAACAPAQSGVARGPVYSRRLLEMVSNVRTRLRGTGARGAEMECCAP